jgi:hypothetical protein
MAAVHSPPEDSRMLASKLRTIVKTQGSTPTELLRRLNMPESTFWRKWRDPLRFEIGEIDRIADVIGVSRAEILG